jgi:hypothetical protein
MSSRRLTAFIDALASGRRPKRFRAAPEDVDVLRTAITLRSARPGEAAPSDAFVEGLFQQLTEQAKPEDAREIRPVRTGRARTALLATAAAVTLVAGAAVVTETVSNSGPAHTPVPAGSALRTGTFQTTDGQVLGQVVALRGHPSWVFMNVTVPNYDGSMKCTLQDDTGATVATGAFTVHGGKGQWSKDFGGVDISRLRGVKLVDATGTTVAAATFAS